MTPIALGPCGPVDTVTLDGAAFYIRSSRPHSPAAARPSAGTPVNAESPCAPSPAPQAAAPAEGSGAASSVSEVGPDRVVDTGWGKTRPR